MSLSTLYGQERRLRHDFDEAVDRRASDSRKWQGSPDDQIPLWIADTDFKSPRAIIERLRERVEHGVFGYPAPHAGLRRSVRSWMGRRHGWELDEESVLASVGTIPSIARAIRLYSRPGDGVVLQTPAYHPFLPLIPANGRVCLENPLRLEDGRYGPDLELLARQLAQPGTRMLILCNPHNPVGTVFSRAELLAIGELCVEHGIVVVSDEVHADIVYPGKRHLPFAALDPRFAALSVTCANPNKTFNIAGSRTSAVIIPDPALRARYEADLAADGTPGPSIFGMIPFQTAYNECADYADQLVEYLDRGRAMLRQAFGDPDSPVRLVEPEASFLAWLDCRGLGLGDPALESFFLEQARVRLSPGISFGPGGSGCMRLNFACTHALLAEALERIGQALGRARRGL